MNYKLNFMTRIFDYLFSIFILFLLFPFLLFIYFLLFLENRSPLFFQERVGKNSKKFTLIKFRTMKIGTKDCPTHLIDKSKITFIGSIIRKTKIDEIPQFLNVLRGEMSIVGPRPCLLTQNKLLKEREKLNIHKTIPGITGLAQIKGIDMSDPYLLAKTEYKMIRSFSMKMYFYYILKTFTGSGFGDKVRRN